MSDITAVWRPRLTRLKQACGSVNLTGLGRKSGAPLVAVTSSRLGCDVRLHRHVCQFLRQSLMDCHRRGGQLLVGSGSAIEPWAERAAELFGVPCQKLVVDSTDESAQLVVARLESPPISVDAAVIALADRVDALYVRRGGLIAKCLLNRLNSDRDASVRVAVMPTRKCAAPDLIHDGAIGWLDASWWDTGLESLAAEPFDSLPRNRRAILGDHPANHWGRSDGQWLVHCTRGRVGKWPEETERQYRDSLLLGGPSSAQRGPLDALLRIVRTGRIQASARASHHGYPVVCLSALSLEQLLDRRCFRLHLGRWDYEPFGVAIRIPAAQQQGVQRVIYGNKGDRSTLSETDQFRFHPLGRNDDWSAEQEWRSRESIDLKSLDPQDVRVFALDSEAARSALRDCDWQVSFLATEDRVIRSV